MGQALYRKYRPKALKDVVGQEHVTNTLEQALKQDRISHAYLFTGPRGVGKTSIARILAHEINGLPYTDDSLHIDIIEIDAASNRRIDEMRELRDKVYVSPTSAKYKVYIIDEVHMLTKESFNALLKTLEEPPAHVVFILATTEAHKLPDTIVSRTQRFSFKPVDKARVAAHLDDIAKQEKIKIDPEALELLAEHGEGSFRDSISLLDQLGSQTRQISAADARHLLGIPPSDAIDGLLKTLANGGEPGALVSRLEDLFAGGYQPAGIAKRLSQRLRRQLVEDRSDLPAETMLRLLKELIEVPAAHDPRHFLEITLLGVLPNKPAAPLPAKEHMQDDKPEQPAEKVRTQPAGSAPFDETIWPKVLQTLKQNHNTLYGVVRMAEPSFIGEDTLELAFAFAFHEKRIKEASNRQKLADVIFELTGKKVKVDCTLDKSAKPPKVPVEAVETAPDPDLDAISNIFGAAELLES